MSRTFLLILTCAGLLNDLYYESMNSRKCAIHSADAATCDWIWNTNFVDWVRVSEPESNAFWICGKPGSGKSTLMKYLSNCRELKSELPEADWTVVNFYFDFRLKEQVGNTLEGLQRSLLIQIIEQTPNLPPSIHAVAKSCDASMTTFNELFEKVFAAPTLHLFITVDGLDEYSGNMRLLMEFLLSVSRRKNVKLCLASRPNATIKLFLGSHSLQMSDHNSEGIRKYIDTAIEPFVEALSEVRLEDIRFDVEQRAEGVFLWVYFAVEEILQACSAGDTAEEIQTRLNNIPDALDALYQRMLDSIPEKRAVEAAIIYALVDSAEVPLNVTLLHSIMTFLSSECCSECQIATVDNEQVFERRLQASMGGFLHLQKEESIPYEPVYARKMRLAEHGTAITYVRIMHKTVTSYMSRSAWVQKQLPLSFTNWFPDYICERLAAKALVAGDTRAGSHLEHILASMHGTFSSLKDFRLLIEQITGDDVLARWTPLIHFSIVYIFSRCLDVIFRGENTQLTNALEVMLRTRLATLHFAMSFVHYEDYIRPSNKYLDPEVGDLMLAAAHCHYTYVTAHEDRIKSLQDYQQDGILVQLTSISDLYGGPCLMGLYHDKTKHITDVDVRGIVKLVLSHQRVITSFHVALCLLMGTLETSFIADKLLLKSDEFARLTIWMPSWNAFLWDALKSRNLLFIWAYGATFSWAEDSHPEAQLHMLLSLGCNIDYQNKAGMNVVHYLVTTHLFGHVIGLDSPGIWFLDIPFWDRADEDYSSVLHVVEKLYLVEEHGASFTTIGKYGTPLQAFTRSRGLLLQDLQGKLLRRRTNNGYLAKVMIILDELGFLLKHKEAKGHLPRPMVQEYDLQHYRCWPRKWCNVCSGGSTVVYNEEHLENPEDHECLGEVDSTDEDESSNESSSRVEEEEEDQEFSDDKIVDSRSGTITTFPTSQSQEADSSDEGTGDSKIDQVKKLKRQASISLSLSGTSKKQKKSSTDW